MAGFFTNIFRFSLTWGPMGAKIQNATPPTNLLQSSFQNFNASPKQNSDSLALFVSYMYITCCYRILRIVVSTNKEKHFEWEELNGERFRRQWSHWSKFIFSLIFALVHLYFPCTETRGKLDYVPKYSIYAILFIFYLYKRFYLYKVRSCSMPTSFGRMFILKWTTWMYNKHCK